MEENTLTNLISCVQLTGTNNYLTWSRQFRDKANAANLWALFEDHKEKTTEDANKPPPGVNTPKPSTTTPNDGPTNTPSTEQPSNPTPRSDEEQRMNIDEGNSTPFAWQFLQAQRERDQAMHEYTMQKDRLDRDMAEARRNSHRITQAVVMLNNHISPIIRTRIRDFNNDPKTAWVYLRQQYAPPLGTVITGFMDTMSNLRFDNKKGAQHLINTVHEATLNVVEYGSSFGDDLMVESVLRILPKEYEVFREIWKRAHKHASQSWEEFAGELITKEEEIRQSRALYQSNSQRTSVQSSTSAFGTTPRRSGPSPQSDSPQTRPDSQTKPKCSACGRLNHTKDTCWIEHPELMPERIRKKMENNRVANTVCVSTEDYEDVEELFSRKIALTAQDDTLSSELKKDSWIIDSGANIHLTNDKKWFSNFRDLTLNVGTADGKGKVKILGTGTVSLEVAGTKDVSLDISSVSYAPEVRYNILSMSQLTKKAGLHGGWGEQGISILTKDNRKVATARPVGGIFILNIVNIPVAMTVNDCSTFVEENPLCMTVPNGVRPPLVSNINYSNPVWKWHRRLGHIGLGNLRKLLAVADGIDLTDDQIKKMIGAICPVCAITKTIITIPKEPAHTVYEALGDLIHADVWGPYAVKGYDGSKYVLAFTDSATRFTWIFPLVSQAKMITHVRSFHDKIEKGFDTVIRRYRFDQGFNTTDINIWLNSIGVIVEHSAPYAHHQNGVAERQFRTIRERTSAMIHEQRIPDHIKVQLDEKSKEFLRNAERIPDDLWPEAFRYATWLRNRSPSRGLQDSITPWEALYKQKPNFQCERVWGSRAYVAQPREIRATIRKIHDTRGMMGLFMGCDNESTYRIWNVPEKRILVTPISTVDKGDFDDESQETDSIANGDEENTFTYQDDQSEDEQEQGDIPATSNTEQTLLVQMVEVDDPPEEEEQKPFKCSHCASVPRNYKALKKHAHKRHHDIGTAKCSTCNLELNIVVLPTHMEVIHGRHNVSVEQIRAEVEETYLFKCEICEETALNFDRLKQHVSNNHTDIPITTCKLCGSKMRQALLQAHLQSKHDTEEINEEEYNTQYTFECQTCSHRFTNHGTYIGHVIRVHDGFPYKQFKTVKCLNCAAKNWHCPRMEPLDEPCGECLKRGLTCEYVRSAGQVKSCTICGGVTTYSGMNLHWKLQHPEEHKATKAKGVQTREEKCTTCSIHHKARCYGRPCSNCVKAGNKTCRDKVNEGHFLSYPIPEEENVEANTRCTNCNYRNRREKWCRNLETDNRPTTPCKGCTEKGDVCCTYILTGGVRESFTLYTEEAKYIRERCFERYMEMKSNMLLQAQTEVLTTRDTLRQLVKEDFGAEPDDDMLEILITEFDELTLEDESEESNDEASTQTIEQEKMDPATQPHPNIAPSRRRRGGPIGQDPTQKCWPCFSKEKRCDGVFPFNKRCTPCKNAPRICHSQQYHKEHGNPDKSMRQRHSETQPHRQQNTQESAIDPQLKDHMHAMVMEADEATIAAIEEANAKEEQKVALNLGPTNPGLRGSQRSSGQTLDPTSYKEAMSSTNSQEWQEAVKEEYDSLLRNKTWEVVDSTGQKPLSRRWIFKRKLAPDGKVTRYKARFMVQGFEQAYGVDFDETFASVVKPPSYKILFATQPMCGTRGHQVDVKTAFLHGDITDEIYISPPEGFPEAKGKVLKLLKGVYGLKQSPRIWYQKLRKFLEQLGFAVSSYDPSIFLKDDTIISVYVDDMNIFATNLTNIQQHKEDLREEFKISDLGLCSWYLGMNVATDQDGTTYIWQSSYIQQILERFGLQDIKPVSIPIDPNEKLKANKLARPSLDFIRKYQSMVGSLNYLMVVSRADIAFAVGKVSQYMSNPTDLHMKAVLRIFAYLKKTINLGFKYQGQQKLHGYVDSDYSNCPDTAKSTSGYVFLLAGAPIAWKSKKQDTVALSTCEAEYMAATEAVKEATWIGNFLSELNLKPQPFQYPIRIDIDNNSAMKLSKNPEFHGRTKHIHNRHHFIREKVNDGTVVLNHISTGDNIADIFTKPLPRPQFEYLRDKMGMKIIPEDFPNRKQEHT